MHIKIKLAKPEDAELLASICAKTFSETYSNQVKKENLVLYIEKSFSKEKISKELEDKNSVFFIAFKDDEFIGYTKLNKNKKNKKLQNYKSMELERMYVLRKMIGQKIGKSLMEKCLELATKENYQAIWLGVWEQNKSAISFYKKWGFDIFGNQIFKLAKEKHKDLLMKKNIIKNQTTTTILT